MSKNYVIWWHTKYVDELDRSAITIEEIVDNVGKTLKDLEKLKILEKAGKIKVKPTGTLNPIYIQILDDSIESEVVNNPIIEIVED